MSYWQGVRNLLWNDISNARWKNLLFLAFVGYMALFTYEDLSNIAQGENGEVSRFIFDFIYFMLFATVGLITTHLYGRGFKKDLIAERLAYWRSLPIKVDQIVYSRVTGVTIFSMIAVIAYYILIAFIMYISNITYDVIPYIIHGFTAYAIIYIFNLIYLYLEMCKSFKKYTVYCWVFPFILIIVIALYTLTADFSLLVALYEAVRAAPLLMTCASIILIAASYMLAVRVIDRKIRERNL